MNIPLLTFGLFLAFISIVNCRVVKAAMSSFKQWCKRTDPMDRIALLLVLGVPGVVLANWGWF